MTKLSVPLYTNGVEELSKKISEVASIIGADGPNQRDDAPVLNMSQHIRENNTILEECLVMLHGIREKLG